MAYSADSFVADEQPTTTKWNKLWSNDAALRDGSGVLWANNQAVNAANSGGTAKQMLRLGSDNYARYGQWPRQDNTTNSTEDNVLIQYGWGFITGDTTEIIKETVTFPVAYTSAPIVMATRAGNLVGSNPSAVSDLTAAPFATNVTIPVASQSITTTNFILNMARSSGTFSNTTRYGYTWVAIGPKS